MSWQGLVVPNRIEIRQHFLTWFAYHIRVHKVMQKLRETVEVADVQGGV